MSKQVNVNLLPLVTAACIAGFRYGPRAALCVIAGAVAVTVGISLDNYLTKVGK